MASKSKEECLCQQEMKSLHIKLASLWFECQYVHANPAEERLSFESFVLSRLCFFLQYPFIVSTIYCAITRLSVDGANVGLKLLGT
jgi:hypothetical protein